MRTLLNLILLFTLCVAGRAGQLITATITVTNSPADGDTITVNGSVRTWKNTVATPATQITIGAAIGAHATNMWSQFASYRFTTLTPGFPATNQVTLRGAVDQTITVSIAGTWGFYTLTTNTTASGNAVIVPGSSYATQSTPTNIISLLSLDLGTYSTNKLANGTKFLEGVVQTNQNQVVNGQKHFTGATILSNTATAIIGGSTTNMHVGATNAWIGNAHFYGPLLITNTNPKIVWFDSDATADNGTIEMSGANGDLNWRFYNDAGGSYSEGFKINRTGATVDSVQFPNGDVQIGGAGVGTEKLTVIGSTLFNRADITTLSSSNNAAIDLENRTFARITTGPSAAFNINGIAGGADGKTVFLYNSTAYQMTIYNDSGVDPTPGNRIYTLVGSNIVCTAAILVYDSGASRWIVMATPSITDVTGSGGSGTYVPFSMVEDIAYDATTWNSNTNIATKNAIRDKFESLTPATAINATDGYLPYRSSSSAFSDSPFYRIRGDSLGVNSTNWAVIINPTNTFIGDRAHPLTSGVRETALGNDALESVTSGTDNTAVGDGALSSVSTANYNTAVGSGAARFTTGAGNTSIGRSAGANMSSGTENTLVGTSAGNVSGGTYSRTTAIGASSALNSTSSDAVAVGHSAGITGATLNRGVFIGSQQKVNNERVDRDFTDTIWIGFKSSTSATNNVQTITNSVFLGSNIIPGTSNTAQIGTNGVTVLYLNGTVGWFRGSGSPESAVTAPVGSFYSREDGGAGTSWYVKESGTGNTGWAAK